VVCLMCVTMKPRNEEAQAPKKGLLSHRKKNCLISKAKRRILDGMVAVPTAHGAFLLTASYIKKISFYLTKNTSHSITKTNRSMLLRKIIALNSENQKPKLIHCVAKFRVPQWQVHTGVTGLKRLILFILPPTPRSPR
jgi:hypothetical protein